MTSEKKEDPINKSAFSENEIKNSIGNENLNENKNDKLVNYKSMSGATNIDLVAKEKLKEKKIPASAFSRAFSFGQLGLSVLGGGIAEAIKQNLVFLKKTNLNLEGLE